ncbi:MAG: hypothetical protein A3J38_10185 [Gammaproteobacteria bacterium RIFCSPHIGHO2_12_FULL_45_9]|nr:MAG: hypothetical protein A3J38_10185 [Gammaproteobacteria bacterium RIFCSPHIGHO2_12_FULL_45_9]
MILVSALPAASGYNTANMLYTKTPYDVQAYALHAWVAPPGDLLLPVIVKALTATGHFKAVVMAPFTGATTLQLQMTLLMLQQEFTQDNQSRVHLSIQANLLNTTTGRVLANRIFTAVVPAGADAYSGVLATNQAARQIAVQVQQMVVEKD